MKANTKIQAAVKKTGKNVPIVAWAVEVDGKINPEDTFVARARARDFRNAVVACTFKSAHTRKIMIVPIPGR